jgi:plasmid stabilization system protein ParE
MSLQVRYSLKAKQEYVAIIQYIILNFVNEKAILVDEYFDNAIRQISMNPRMYPLFDKKRKIRRCVLSKQTTLFYRFEGKNVELVSFRSNLMNPQREI